MMQYCKLDNESFFDEFPENVTCIKYIFSLLNFRNQSKISLHCFSPLFSTFSLLFHVATKHIAFIIIFIFKISTLKSLLKFIFLKIFLKENKGKLGFRLKNELMKISVILRKSI